MDSSEKIVGTIQPGQQQRKLGYNEAMISGRIELRRKFTRRDGQVCYASRIVLPAPSAFDAPSAVMVESSSSIGAVGDDIRVAVRIGGFRGSFKDKGTGEAVATAYVNLAAVED